MKLFYTGAKTNNEWQLDPEKSLGGYISECEVPNSLLENVFSDISLLGQQNESIETKAIALKNTTSAAVTNIYLYFTYPLTDKNAKLEIGKEAFVDNKIGTIQNSRALPYGITFFQPSRVGTKILLASSLAVGEAIGIWLRRTILPAPVNSVADVDLEDYLKNRLTRENIEISIQYD
jgi:hypothetical protein